MKQGTTLQQMVYQLKTQDTQAKDYTLHAPLIRMDLGDPLPPVETEYDALDQLLRNVATDFDGQPMVGPGQTMDEYMNMGNPPVGDEVLIPGPMPLITLDGGRAVQPNRVFHQQMATELKIPYDYYKRQWASHPEDLARDVNSWLRDMHVVKGVERPVHGSRTVRTLGNTARAFVSSKYRRLDNYPLMMACMEHLFNLGVTQETVVSCHVTDQKMYIKVVTPKLEGDVGKGDIVQAGIEITNSEVGRGSLAVKPLIFRLVCLNGAVMGDHGVRKTHLGKSEMGDEENGWEVYSDDTKRKADDALFAQVGDVVKHTLSEEVFGLELEKIRAANSDEIAVEPLTAVERVVKNYSFTEKDQDRILQNFLGDGAPTRWTMANAVTLASQSDDVSYERASEMERAGGQLIEDDNVWMGVARLDG
jgi:hypothetical protein